MTANRKENLWCYWENPSWWDNMYGYIQMCLDTFYHHCGKTFIVNLITRDNINRYIDDLPGGFWEWPHICTRSDYIRIVLTFRYGGIWLDIDTLLMRPIDHLRNILDKYGAFWGCGSRNFNGVLGFTPKNLIAAKSVDIMNQLIITRKKDLSRCDLGWNILKLAKQKLYSSMGEQINHFMLPSKWFYSISWGNSHILQQDVCAKKYCVDDIYGLCIWNHKLTKKRKWFYKMKKNEILEMNCLFSNLYKISMEKDGENQ